MDSDVASNGSPVEKVRRPVQLKEELEKAPCPRSGEVIDDMLENWEECPLPGKKHPRTKPLHGVWKARSVFWDLPY
jgi:hypothetical protein